MKAIYSIFSYILIADDVVYAMNKNSKIPFKTDYMILSPCVEIFRDQNNQLQASPRTTAVLTISAPNLLYDPKVYGVSQQEVDD